MFISIQPILDKIIAIHNERGGVYGDSYLDTRNSVRCSQDLIHTIIQLKNDRLKAINESIAPDISQRTTINTNLINSRNDTLLDIATYCIIELALTEGEGE